MICPVCRYVLNPFDVECPRCRDEKLSAPLTLTDAVSNGTLGTQPPPAPRPYFDYNPRTEGLCGRCRKPNLYTERACKRCGHRLPWAKIVTIPPPADTPATATPPSVTPPSLPLSNYSTILDDDDSPPYSPPTSDAPHDSVSYLPHDSSQKVSNEVVWLIAFAPLIAILIQGFAANAWHVSIASLWWITPLLNSLLCLVDLNILSNARKNTEGLTSWAIFLVPIYLFLRAERLDEPPTYGWVWIAIFAVTILPTLVIPVIGPIVVVPATP